MGIPLKIINCIKYNTLRIMYFTFIYPYLFYCIKVWGNAHHTHFDPLIKIQGKRIRIITLYHYLAHIIPCCKNCYANNLLLMFKNHFNIFPTPLSVLLIVNNTSQETTLFYFYKQKHGYIIIMFVSCIYKNIYTIIIIII